MVLRDDGDIRGRAPKESGKADSEDSDDSSGGDSLDGSGRGRLRGREPVGGALRDSAGGAPLTLDVPETSEDEEVEEGVEEDVEADDEDEEAAEEDGLPLPLDAGLLPWECCSRRGWARCVGVELYAAAPQAKCSSPA